jgi:hypothetical protein
MFILAKSNDLKPGSLSNYHHFTLTCLIPARKEWFSRQDLILEIGLGKHVKLLLFPDLKQAYVAILTAVEHGQHAFGLLSHHVNRA